MVENGVDTTGHAFAFDVLATLLIELLQHETITSELKSTTIEPVSYINSILLRKQVVVQVLSATLTLYNRLGACDCPTYMINGAMSSLLTVLGMLTRGTEQDAKEFIGKLLVFRFQHFAWQLCRIGICVSTLHNSDWSDERAPTFIFDRLASTIHSKDDQVS